MSVKFNVMLRDILVQTGTFKRQLVVRKGQAGLWQHEPRAVILVPHHDVQGQRLYAHADVMPVDGGQIEKLDAVLSESLTDFFASKGAASGVKAVSVAACGSPKDIRQAPGGLRSWTIAMIVHDGIVTMRVVVQLVGSKPTIPNWKGNVAQIDYMEGVEPAGGQQGLVPFESEVKVIAAVSEYAAGRLAKVPEKSLSGYVDLQQPGVDARPMSLRDFINDPSTKRATVVFTVLMVEVAKKDQEKRKLFYVKADGKARPCLRVRLKGARGKSDGQ